jgi:hypothetical protein
MRFPWQARNEETGKDAFVVYARLDLSLRRSFTVWARDELEARTTVDKHLSEAVDDVAAQFARGYIVYDNGREVGTPRRLAEFDEEAL